MSPRKKKSSALKTRPGLGDPLRPNLVLRQTVSREAPLDARAAFVLSLIDGKNTVDDLLDIAAMPEAEFHAHLANLVGLGIVRLS